MCVHNSLLLIKKLKEWNKNRRIIIIFAFTRSSSGSHSSSNSNISNKQQIATAASEEQHPKAIVEPKESARIAGLVVQQSEERAIVCIEDEHWIRFGGEKWNIQIQKNLRSHLLLSFRDGHGKDKNSFLRYSSSRINYCMWRGGDHSDQQRITIWIDICLSLFRSWGWAFCLAIYECHSQPQPTITRPSQIRNEISCVKPLKGLPDPWKWLLNGWKLD